MPRHTTAALVSTLVSEHRAITRALFSDVPDAEVLIYAKALEAIESRLRDLLGEAEAAATLAGDAW